MLDNIYPFTISHDFLTFGFKSVGPRGAIDKIIRYRESEIGGIFNLGFGNVDTVTGFEDDLVVTDNGDSKKILKTVASTLYVFTDHYPDAIIMASGSTGARTRLYRIGITTNLQAIEKDFTIWGYVKDDWEPFEMGINYDAFLVKRKL